MKRIPLILIITFILAFCSIAYELLLGQALSAFLGNTVLRYSTTIGLYMFSMGIGSLLAGERLAKKPELSLLIIEIGLTLFGGGSLLLLAAITGVGISSLIFSVTAYSLIIAIGILTGFEIPLLIYIYNKKRPHSDNVVLGVDYLGALVGAVTFAAVFYPVAGLVQTSMVIALLNAITGLLLWSQRKEVKARSKKLFRGLMALQGALAVLLIIGLVNVEAFREYFIQQYLAG